MLRRRGCDLARGINRTGHSLRTASSPSPSYLNLRLLPRKTNAVRSGSNGSARFPDLKPRTLPPRTRSIRLPALGEGLEISPLPRSAAVRQVGEVLGRPSSEPSVQPCFNPPTAPSTWTNSFVILCERPPTYSLHSRRYATSPQPSTKNVCAKTKTRRSESNTFPKPSLFSEFPSNNSLAIASRVLERYAVASFVRCYSTPAGAEPSKPDPAPIGATAAGAQSLNQAQPPARHPSEPEEVVIPKEKKGWPQRIREGIWHYWTGTKLLALNIKATTLLLSKSLRGENLTRRERKLLTQTTVDLFRLIPFIAIVVIPFAEFSLPFLLKLFPNMLPSTFEDKLEKEEKRKKQVHLKLEMAKFLQEALELRTSQLSGTPSASNFAGLMKKVKQGYKLNTEEIISCSKLFEDEFTLENLGRDKIVAMCRYMGILPFGTTSYLRNQLIRKLEELKEDDELIKEEGIDSLTGSELRSACQARGMIYQNYPHAKTQLEQWLNLSLEKDVPASLLILSRALALSPADSRPPTPWYEPKAKEVEPAGQLAEALQQTISGLPETLLENTQLNCPTTAPEDNQVKLQALKTEMGKIKQEEEQRKQEKEKEKQEKLEKEKKEKVASESAPIAMEKKHKAPTAEDLLQVTEAVTTLASSSASTVMKERSELAELKEMLEDQKQALKDLAAAERKEELARPSTEPKKAEKKDKVMTQLEAELETIVKRLDKELDEVDKETKSFFSLVDKNKDGYISFDEFNFAMEQLRKKYSPEEVRDMFAMLDLNSDGQISIHDLHQLVSEKEKVDDLRAKRLVDGVKKVTKDILNARTDTQTPTQQQAQQ